MASKEGGGKKKNEKKGKGMSMRGAGPHGGGLGSRSPGSTPS